MVKALALPIQGPWVQSLVREVLCAVECGQRKIKPHKQEDISANHTSNKGVVSRT